MKVSIFYTRTNVSGFSFNPINFPFVDVRHYDKRGNFLLRTTEKPKLQNHYKKVDEVELDSIDSEDEEILNNQLDEIFRLFNSTEKTGNISKRIENGSLMTEHSSMSVGDVIEINERYYIVQGIGFGKINL